MARIPPIYEGQPITYETLNLIIQEVNKIKNLPEDFGQDIVVYGNKVGIGRSEGDDVKIAVGTATVQVKQNDITKNVTLPFDSVFSKPPVVVATIVDTQNGKNNAIQMATITIINITNNNAEARIQLLKAEKKNQVDLEVNYIAIGAGPRASA